MRNLLFVAALSVALVSCDKEQEPIPQFRMPTCTDTTDDAKFEAYTKPEYQEFLRFYNSVPETEDVSAVPYVGITSHILYNNSNTFDPVFRYKQNRPTNLVIYMPIGGPEKYFSWVRNSTEVTDTSTVAIFNARSLTLAEGCYRMYYIFADSAYGNVLNKGHIDIEVRQ